MSESVLTLAGVIEDWDGDEVVCRFDRESASWMFICIHSLVRGPAAGGTRVRVYASAAEALLDGLRLASGMTRKNALAELPWGGGKAVIAVPAVPRGEARRLLYRRYAEMVNSLGGNFVTGPDMNTYAEDLDLIQDACPYLFGSSASVQDGRSVADSTAYGVLCAIRACLEHVHGNGELAGRSIVVQGVGGVGSSLARQLLAAGAVVKICDVDDSRIAEFAGCDGVEVIPVDAALSTTADVFAPCAGGGVLTVENAAHLPVRVVAGGANNQLFEPRVALVLHEAGVLYAPDFVANSGGAIHCVCVESLAWGSAAVVARIERIAETLHEIFERSARLGVSTDAAAEMLAMERLVAEPRMPQPAQR